MTGLEMGLLARRLQSYGFVCYRFPYSSLWQKPKNSADALARFIEELPHPVVHLLGHSLGGRVIELMLSRRRPALPGRVLTIATPFAGSHIAHRLARRPWGKILLGAAAPALLTEVPRWRHQRPLGTIAGDRGLGIGVLFPGLPRPHDGSVGLSETVIAGATARFTVHGSHLGLLFSREVAELAAAFLQSGSFTLSPTRAALPRTRPCEAAGRIPISHGLSTAKGAGPTERESAG